MHGLKAGAHHAGAEADPDMEGSPDPAIVERIASWVRERFPEVDPDPVEAQSCLYTTTSDGMGLGLAICRTVIESHGGRLWAEAREGGGTCFHFRLPLASDAAIPAALPIADATALPETSDLNTAAE